MLRKKIAILPEINNCSGDIQKKWFIYFSCRDPRNDKMIRFKVYSGLHKIKDYDERMQAALVLKEQYTNKLRNGWTPFVDDAKAIYEDQLQYNLVAKIYGKMRSANRNIRYYSSRYIEQRRSDGGLEPETISNYTSKLRIFNLWIERHDFAEDDISTISNKTVQDFFRYLINDLQLSHFTIRRYRLLVRNMFDLACKEKAIQINPVFDIPVCKRINDQSPRPIAEFDIMAFKEAISKEDPQLWLAISFEYYCFLRPGKELRLLKIKDIDFARGVIDVDAVRAKTNMERFPTIPFVFLKELREYYKLHKFPGNHYVLGKEGMPGLIPLSKNTLRNRFRKFREQLDMPDSYKFYSWKHTGNGRASDAGISTRDLMQQNGHTSIKTTEIYMRHKIGKISKDIQEKFPEL